MQIATDLDYHNMRKLVHCGKIMVLYVKLSA